MVPPKSSILIGVSIINHPFWGTPIFGNIHMKCIQAWNIIEISIQINNVNFSMSPSVCHWPDSNLSPSLSASCNSLSLYTQLRFCSKAIKVAPMVDICHFHSFPTSSWSNPIQRLLHKVPQITEGTVRHLVHAEALLGGSTKNCWKQKCENQINTFDWCSQFSYVYIQHWLRQMAAQKWFWFFFPKNYKPAAPPPPKKDHEHCVEPRIGSSCPKITGHQSSVVIPRFRASDCPCFVGWNSSRLWRRYSHDLHQCSLVGLFLK